MKFASSHAFSPRLGLLALAGALLLPGCATRAPMWPATDLPPSGIAASVDGGPAISVPPSSVGQWYDLGSKPVPWMTGDAPAPASGAVPTRVVGLRRPEDGRWLALVIVQAAPLVPPCPAPTTLTLPAPGPAGCLRMRRDGDFDGWLESHNPVLAHWLDTRELNAMPRQWVAYRTGKLEVQALVDPNLLEPKTRTNDDFLNAGLNGMGWVDRLATSAVRAAAEGTPLAVPPFPFAAATPLLPPEPVAAAAPAAPAAPAASAAPAARR